MPTFYECDRCTACCRWPGQVALDAGEIARLAAHLQLTEHAFIQQYTRLAANRSGLALEEKPNGECIFLEGINCRIQEVKPRQCRGFPNRWRFPGFEAVCRARPREVSEEEFSRLTRPEL